MPAISVIMPVYNSELYVGTAIESVLCQTMEDFELILVDDGSTDRSPEICDTYAARDARVVVCHQKNTGICRARNKGVDLARGDYLAFIDNDDVYDPDLLKENYALALQQDADVVKYGCCWKKLRGAEVVSEEMICANCQVVLHAEDLAEYYPRAMRSEIITFVWNGLYRRSFLAKEAIRFNPLYRSGYEDMEFNLRLYPNVRCMVWNPKIYYTWQQRMGGGTSTKFDASKPPAIIELMKLETDIFSKMGLPEKNIRQRRIAGFAAYIGALLHPASTLATQEKLRALEKFRAVFPDIPATASMPVHQNVYAICYNHGWDRLLLVIKKLVHLLQRVRYGNGYVR